MASKPKHLHRITEKGRKYKANPPAEIEAAGGTTTPPVTETVTETVLPQTPVLEEKSDEEKDDEGKIPSQADIFRSVAEQLKHFQSKGRNSPRRYNQLCSEDGGSGQPEPYPTHLRSPQAHYYSQSSTKWKPIT